MGGNAGIESNLSDRSRSAVTLRVIMQSRPIITAHRFARLVAWLGAVLMWCALGRPLQGAAHRRHHRRYGNVGIVTLRRAVLDLIIIRAAELLGPRPSRNRRDFAPRGFRRRISKPAPSRVVAGAWLRRRRKIRGSFIAQVRRLIEALRHLRGLAAHLAWRRRGGLTRVSPILLICAITSPLRTCAATAPASADTS